MTLLPTSKFEFGQRRLLYATSGSIVVYEWRDNRAVALSRYTADEDGEEGFSSYLQTSANVATYILTDVIEEDYRQETLPHVFGSDRQGLLKHRKSRLFRDTPYIHTRFQGRESKGRRDDKVLFTALTNPQTLAPWIRQLTRNKVPLYGIHSVAGISSYMLKHLGIDEGPTLLVSLQSRAGLRQTFFDGKELKVSRLVRVPKLDAGQSPSVYILGEVEKVRRYLISTRQYVQSESLLICILAHGSLAADLKRRVTATSQVRYRVVGVDEIGADMGLEETQASSFSDNLFAQIVLKNRPPNQYAGSKERRYATLQIIRRGLYAASVLALVGSVVWSVTNVMEGFSYKAQIATVQNKADYYQARYQLAREALPDTPVDSTSLQLAVEAVDTLQKYRAMPYTMFSVLSQALIGFNDIKIDRIEWEVDNKPGLSSAPRLFNLALDTGGIDPGILGVEEKTNGLYHIAVVTARIESFEGNYRNAIEIVDAFVEALSSNVLVDSVERLKMPLDVSSQERMSGDAGQQARKESAPFELRVVVWKQNDST